MISTRFENAEPELKSYTDDGSDVNAKSKYAKSGGLFGNGCWSSNINLPKSTQQKKEASCELRALYIAWILCIVLCHTIVNYVWLQGSSSMDVTAAPNCTDHEASPTTAISFLGTAKS